MRGVREVRLDERPLQRVERADALFEGSYLMDGDRTIVCWRPEGRQRLTLAHA
jgi:hypothetical protein